MNNEQIQLNKKRTKRLEKAFLIEDNNFITEEDEILIDSIDNLERTINSIR